MKYRSLMLKTLLAASFALALAACSDNTAEEAGENVDDAMTDAGNAIEDTCEDVKEGMNAEDKDC